jgi:uncharacterized protein YfaS (alpha-2-macroglobulin family)
MKSKLVVGGAVAVLALGVACWAAAVDAPVSQRRDAARKASNAGNYNDAYKTLAPLVTGDVDDPHETPQDFELAVQCLQRLARSDEIDEFREKAITAHPKNWRLLHAAAQSLHNGETYGFVVAGKFYRGGRRGNDGRQVSALQRDRVRALQLMLQAEPMATADPSRSEAGAFLISFADMVLDSRQGNHAWRLQYLTDLSTLPDYDDANVYYHGGQTRGAPVDENGNPVFHSVPKSFADATTDGQRWRWCLQRATDISPDHAGQVRYTFADFLRQQFDVQTMAQWGYRFGYRGYDEDAATEVAAPQEEKGADSPDKSGPYAVSTLAEDETIARLASGIKRFKLPDEFNFIRIFQSLAESEDPWSQNAHQMLSTIFTDRQQYPRAAHYWRENIRRFGDPDGYKGKYLNQILGNWGRFDPRASVPAGEEPTLGFLFRNGRKVSFTAHEVKVRELLDDIKAYLRNRGARQLDWQALDVQNLGYRLIERGEAKYLGKRVAQWDMTLEPRDKHFDKRVSVKAPLTKGGCYLVTASMEGGNDTRIVLWVADSVLVKKPLDGGSWYFVADAKTGQPLAKATLEFFGYRQRHLGDNRWATDTNQFAEFTDASGQFVLKGEERRNEFTYLISATTPDGHFAYHGFTGAWYGRWYDSEYNQTKAFGITDRPVYRPGQPAKFKFWVGQAKYDQPRDANSPYAGHNFSVEVHNPKGEKVFEKPFTADEFGGFAGEFAVPSDATLGVYSAIVGGVGSVSFRVEEYKKPEFEVKVDAPAEPVALGDSITATITARYYFGAPVTEAKVKYKVIRSDFDAAWYPPSKWDWFYGPGYWWFGCDYAWYPGFHEWGCRAPWPWWWPNFTRQQPEVVQENEVAVGADGTVKVTIDTAVAKAMHGDKDHRYEITAEVTDNSRRTIVGQGTVTAARKPFKVYAWVDRGYYRAGDVVRADFAAQTLDRKPIASAKGKLKLLQVAYDREMKPIEREVGVWDLSTDAEGHAAQQVKAATPGQYRLSYTVTDAKNHSIEGGYVFVVRGEGMRDENFRFNDIEVVAEKKEYKPGEKVRLLINASRANSTVVLFVRPSNGIYLPPKTIRLSGKSTVEELDVTPKDTPNFFVEAFTVADAQIYSQAREVVVPPEDRVVNVEVLPSKTGYKPGEKASVRLRLTDDRGEPVIGSAVVSVYDKSVEYISGGSNVPEVKAFFWKWRRHHNVTAEDSLKGSLALQRPNESGMNDLGVFGHMVGDLALGDRDLFAQGRERKDGRFAERREMAKAMRAGPGAPAAADSAGAGFGGGAVAENEVDTSGGQGTQALVEPTVRKNFADTALWVAALTTGPDGVATVSLDMPENLTTWKTRVWSISSGTRVGQGEAEVVTTKDLLVRLQAPRFFVQTDEVVLSANVHNYLADAKKVKVTLELDGNYLAVLGSQPAQWVTVAPKGEARVDWRVKVVAPGTVVVRAKAQSDVESDAMQMSFPVCIHGMLKTDSYAGALRPSETNASLTIRVPRERLVEQSRLEVRYSPSVAASMVDALPYLSDYPYGCTEQTLNRFIPTVITQRTLLAMGLDLKSIRDKRTNLNAQQIGNDRERAADWRRGNRDAVFDEAVVADMVKQGVTKLTNMQCSDGGWGWFSGWGEHSDAHTTAVVVHGLQIARDSDVALVPGMLERGIEWLKKHQADRVAWIRAEPGHRAWDLDAFVFMVLTDAGQRNQEMSDFLYRDRNDLSAYSKAVYGVALFKLNEPEKLDMVLQNLSQFVVRDGENQTAYLRLPEGNHWWYWYGSDTEANAFYLKLLAKAEPKGELAAGIAKYLINNRRNATYWNSTRDTAYCVEALAEFVKASGEDKPDLTVAVMLDGRKVKEVKIDRENLFSFDNAFLLTGADVPAGDHKLEFVKQGTGALYFNAYVTNFTLEDSIKRAGLEVKVSRQFYRLVPVKGATAKVAGAHGQALDQRVEKYERRRLADGDTLASGELVEVELEIDSKNDYEYLLFEDMKAAGFEPVEVRSGYNGNDLGAYVEFRDERVCFFARTLSRGKHSVAYRLRAEVPGKFSALPTKASAMYAPELKANSDEAKLNIQDAPAIVPTAATSSAR